MNDRWRMFEPPVNPRRTDRTLIDRFPDPDADPGYWRVTDRAQRARLVMKVGGEVKKERGR